MHFISITIVVAVSIAAILSALTKPGGCLRFPFLCGALYLIWVAPQLYAVSVDNNVPDGGVFWLNVTVVLCLAATLIGWSVGLKQPVAPKSPSYRTRTGTVSDEKRLLSAAFVLSGFMLLLHLLIAVQPIEDRELTQWSGPLTIIVFFLILSSMSLFLSLLLAFKLRTLGSYLVAGVNIFLCGTSAFVAVRRGVIADFAIATVGALWFGLHKRVAVVFLVAGVLVFGAVTYAIVPLRIAAKEVAERTGDTSGLLSIDVWQQVDFGAEIANALEKPPDFANAVHLIDFANRYEFTWGRQSWDAFVFQWVPAQILGAGFKNDLMFKQGVDYSRIEQEYGYSTTGGTTATGFGFAYQEFGPFGFIYFLAIGVIMGRLWTRGSSGDVWAQALYVSFAGGSLLSVTHHAMWLLVQIPLFLLGIAVFRRIAKV